MARLAIGAAIGLAIGVIAGAALGLHAQVDETIPSDETAQAAELAGVDAVQLLGAMHSTGLGALDYLISVGELVPPGPPTPARPSVPTPGAVRAGGGASLPPAGQATLAYIAAHSRYGARASCVARIESRGFGWAWNPVPWGRWREHAAGFFGWLPSTAATVGVRIGDLASEIAGFDRMLDRGRGREFAGILWRRC